MHGYANPARFLKFAQPATGWFFAAGLLLLTAGAIGGLFFTPPDYLQGESVRILYVHVPAAWLGMAGWAGIAVASLMQLVWRHPLSAVAGRALAPAGATFAAICLATGSIWGRPTWGTWWEWDGRLTSMLILFFLYLGYIALASAERERGGGGRMAALFGMVGGFVAPNNYTFADSLILVSILLLGGIGNPWGVAVATVIVVVVPEKLQTIQEYRFLLYALLVIVVLLFRPEGLLPRPVRRYFPGWRP